MFCDIFNKFSPIALNFIVPVPNLREDATFGIRTVECYELEYIISGTGGIWMDGILYPTAPHTLHFRRPGMVVEGVGIYQSRYIEFNFNSNCDIVDELNAMPNIYYLREHAEVEKIFNSAFSDYFNEVSTEELSFKINIMNLFIIMINDWYYNTQNSNFNTTTAENIKLSMEYIQENFSGSLSVPEMAEQAGYSVYHYTRMFKEIVGSTPIHYLNRCRINHAKQMLVETELSVDEVLFTCGFNSYSYFFRIFKDFCGVTPSQYKRKHKLQANFR